MDISTLQSFFMWCTILNVSLMLFWTAIWLMAPDMVYRTQQRFFPITREYFDRFFYGFLAVFKLLFIVFNLVPFIALLIIGRGMI